MARVKNICINSLKIGSMVNTCKLCEMIDVRIGLEYFCIVYANLLYKAPEISIFETPEALDTE